MKAKMYNYATWIDATDKLSLKKTIEELLNMSKFKVVEFCDYDFIPMGYTAVWILAESHCAVHSFPEEGKTYLELSSCIEDKYNLFLDNLMKFGIEVQKQVN